MHSDSLKISFKHVLPPDGIVVGDVEVHVDDDGFITLALEVPVGHGKLTITASVDAFAATKLGTELTHAARVSIERRDENLRRGCVGCESCAGFKPSSDCNCVCHGGAR